VNMPTLAELCSIQLGHTARGRLEVADADGVRAIQLRDIRPLGGLANEHVARYNMEKIPERYWARPGDVLFRSRGDKNTATALGGAFQHPAVVVMPLIILKPNAKQVDPAYLAWSINQPAAQRHFDECARGTGMRMIPVGCLSGLEIPLPDLATQRLIAEVDQLAERERELAVRLAESRQLLTAFALQERANRHSSHQHGANRVAAPRTGKQEK
jgi:hypothetical protein